MSTLRLDSAGLQALLSSPQGPVARDIQRRTNRVRNAAIRRVPVDEGRLKNSITMEMGMSGGTVVGRVGTNVEYAIYVHEGTGIYVGRDYITPKRGKYLRWPYKNNSGRGRRRYRAGATEQYVYAKRVKGVPPRPFLRDALAAADGTTII